MLTVEKASYLHVIVMIQIKKTDNAELQVLHILYVTCGYGLYMNKVYINK